MTHAPAIVGNTWLRRPMARRRMKHLLRDVRNMRKEVAASAAALPYLKVAKLVERVYKEVRDLHALAAGTADAAFQFDAPLEVQRRALDDIVEATLMCASDMRIELSELMADMLIRREAGLCFPTQAYPYHNRKHSRALWYQPQQKLLIPSIARHNYTDPDSETSVIVGMRPVRRMDLLLRGALKHRKEKQYKLAVSLDFDGVGWLTYAGKTSTPVLTPTTWVDGDFWTYGDLHAMSTLPRRMMRKALRAVDPLPRAPDASAEGKLWGRAIYVYAKCRAFFGTLDRQLAYRVGRLYASQAKMKRVGVDKMVLAESKTIKVSDKLRMVFGPTPVFYVPMSLIDDDFQLTSDLGGYLLNPNVEVSYTHARCDKDTGALDPDWWQRVKTFKRWGGLPMV